ncbi:MAG: hypothetical protein ABIT01_19065, partial [Thermoanaerobaculia bacterium]
SLELGIDIGEIDSVVQLSSPKGIARALQRVGRSGHLVGETSRGRFVPLFLDDLLECAATIEGMRAGDVEETFPPENPLDVLAQQLVAETVALASEQQPVTAAQLFATFRRADPYRTLSRRLFDETLGMLSGKYPRERFAELAPKLVWDRATDRVSPLPAARLAAILDGGTIADRGAYKAVLPDLKTVVGELDEEFVYETRLGDVFLLGSHAWRTLEITHDRVVVEDATGQPARMPFWRGEGLSRTPQLGERIGALKRTIAEGLSGRESFAAAEPALIELLKTRYGCDEGAAATLIGAVRREVADPGGLSSDRRIVFETFPNDLGDPCVLVRSLFGRGVNLPWSLALAGILREETGVDVESVAADDGILLRVPQAEREIPLERLSRLTSKEARERLLSSLPNTPMFGARFRENAQRALLLPRVRSGRRTPFWLQRLKARDLLQTTRNLPDFPIVAETYRDCLKDLWEYDRLLTLLDDLETGAVTRALDVRRFPSPTGASLLFSFVMAFMYEWDAPKAEKGLHALAMNRELLGEVLGEALDDGIRPEAAAAVRDDVSRLSPHRRARSADELLLIFQELGDLTRDEADARAASDGASWLDELVARGSLVPRQIAGESRFVTAEECADWERLEDETTLDRLLLRFFATRGPASARDVAVRFGLPRSNVDASLARLRLEGLVASGSFGQAGGETLWAGARLTESIRRRTLSLLRQEIRPVPAAVYRSFLARRQGAEGGARFRGPKAAERAMALLRGLPLPALSWETALLPARLAEPEPDALDLLSTRGLLVWRAAGAKDPRASRLAFFFRGEGELVIPEGPPDLSSLSAPARSLHERLALSGASFAPDLTASLGITPAELDRALLELVLAGLVTGDGLQGFRELLRDGVGKKRAAASAAAPLAVPPSIGRSPGRTSLRAAEARVAARLGARDRPRGGRVEGSGWGRSGRWSLLSGSGEPMAPGERAESWARILLARWGVVSRAVLQAEDSAVVRWSDVSPVLSRMEMRGDLRRGEFVAGNGPMQYAEEETVDALRSLRDRDTDDEPRLTVVSGADPILMGTLGEGMPDACPLARDELVALRDGALLLRLDPDGTLVLGDPEPSDRMLQSAFSGFQELKRRGRDPLGRPRRLVVSRVGAATVTGTRIVPLLEALGFQRDSGNYVYRAL